MNIALVNPPPPRIIEYGDAPDNPHLGLGYIAAFVRSKNIECAVIDAKFEAVGLEEVQSRLYRQKPDVVGITAMTHEITQADKVARIVKQISPQTITVVGGPHTTALPGQTLAEFPSFDIAVFGEGEHTFFELITTIEKQGSLEGVRGIGYRKANGVQLNEPREPIKDLDELPFPAWDLFPKSTAYPVTTTRGCPFRCNFCMRVSGNRVRKRSPQKIVEELQIDIDVYNARFIHVSDEAFTVDKKYAHEILDLLIGKGLHKKISWVASTRVDLVDYDLLKKIKAAGCGWLAFGVESGNKEILKASKKGITLEQATKAIKMAKEVGLKTGSYFILGHPFETRKTAQDTIKFATKLNTDTVTFGIMVPYPGTEIYEMAKRGEGGYKIISTDWADYNKTIGNSLELETLGRKELERLELLAYLRFYLFNYRFLDLAKLFLSQRRVVLTAIKKLLRGSKQDRSG